MPTFTTTARVASFISKIQVDDTELNELVDAVEGLNVPFDKELWVREMRAGTVDAFVTLLLSKLWNLQSLRICESFAKETRLIGMMFRSCLCEGPGSGMLRPRHFQHLRDASFIHSNDDDEESIMHDTADVLPLFYLPSVIHLSLSTNSPASFSWPANEPDLANLVSLELTTLREAHLGHILKLTKALRILRWQWIYDDNRPDQYNNTIIDFDQFSSALSHVRSTLTELRVEAQGLPSKGMSDEDLPRFHVQGSLSFIRDFDKLRVFEAPYTLLLGLTFDYVKRLEDAIPRNCQFVTLNADLSYHKSNDWWQEKNVIEVIQKWLENSSNSTPCLAGLTLSLAEVDTYSWGSEPRAKVAHICAKAGIQFDVVKLNPPPP